jgi:hypothetical protein
LLDEESGSQLVVWRYPCASITHALAPSYVKSAQAVERHSDLGHQAELRVYEYPTSILAREIALQPAPSMSLTLPQVLSSPEFALAGGLT